MSIGFWISNQPTRTSVRETNLLLQVWNDSKTQIQNTNFVNSVQCLQAVEPVFDILILAREILMCNWVRFGTGVSSREAITLMWRWIIACIGDSIKTKAAEPLQAWMPSTHVWSNFLSPASPQFLNQAPPRAQQLSFPDFLVVPHLVHTLLLLITDRVGADISVWVQEFINTRGTDAPPSHHYDHIVMYHKQKDYQFHCYAILHLKKNTAKLNRYEITFASPDALGPCMSECCVTGMSTVLEPITATGTTATFARLLERAALWACGADHSRRRYDERKHPRAWPGWFWARIDGTVTKSACWLHGKY